MVVTFRFFQSFEPAFFYCEKSKMGDQIRPEVKYLLKRYTLPKAKKASTENSKIKITHKSSSRHLMTKHFSAYSNVRIRGHTQQGLGVVKSIYSPDQLLGRRSSSSSIQTVDKFSAKSSHLVFKNVSYTSRISKDAARSKESLKIASSTKVSSGPISWASDLSQGVRRDEMRYLMRLLPENEEGFSEVVEGEPREGVEGEEEEEEENGKSQAMRQAQKYLRTHRIFEFLQFTSAHLLGNLPENPIQYLLNLLNEILVYRSGLRDPPLLYTRKHLNVLFDMMDKMNTGFITTHQYEMAMVTLGICVPNITSRDAVEDLVPRDDFVTEAYESLSRKLDETIRPRPTYFESDIRIFGHSGYRLRKHHHCKKKKENLNPLDVQ